ncbi:tetratricopeptide repeat protein [Bifidobacterium tsurumiense]|uniref:tetratricopeptide repeat protein n=1 Tax=Bifidobacterium tsurumiense TaxID=356829 RepID=UPI0012B3BD2A|nr:tetratricopeptide repeat protein [Bifidobacterium tsurumiense]MDY4678448.1 tetratricopeptide repeat protein [Bifidobacterium tsurumiense]MSS12053.1 tetratricopeptide repeat protein [Bifidobacterium tsurumiense]
MPEFTPHPHEHGRRRSDDMLSRLLRGMHIVSSDQRRKSGRQEQVMANALPEDAMRVMREQATNLSALVKRRIYPDLPGVPSGVSLGWAQLPKSGGQYFSIGVFMDRGRFTQIALADGNGRVFMGHEPDMDTHDIEPRFMFVEESELHLSDASRLGRNRGRGPFGLPILPQKDADRKPAHALQGGMVGRDDTGRMTWLASWLKSDGRYALEQMRTALPEELRLNLEYRDAMAIGFLVAYVLPRMSGMLIGFGSGNIFRRLNREAPIGAIRRSVEDTKDARDHGMRVSGLEEYFADLMQEAGALDEARGLEAVHGAEKLHLFTSSFSGNYFFTWDSSLDFASALTSLRIEGNLNRFAQISALLEHNANIGAYPVEDTVTKAQAAQIDFILLENPALLTLRTPVDGDERRREVDLADDRMAVNRMVDMARDTAAHMHAEHPDPMRQSESGVSQPLQGKHPVDAAGSEWVYRQALSLLIRQLRLPYRFDMEMRSNLAGGQVAMAFTTAGASMMPMSRYDVDRRTWMPLSQADRAAMSAQYNLRVGLMMAALAFGADAHVKNVTLHIDSIGLEEAVAEQNSAISALMGEAMHAFERMRASNVRVSGAKGDPKDGDIHGDPTLAGTLGSEGRPHDSAGVTGRVGGAEESDDSSEHRESSDSTDSPMQASQADEARESDKGNMEQRQPHSDEVDAEQSSRASLDQRFEDLMRDVDFDSMTFELPEDESLSSEDDADGNANAVNGDAAEEHSQDDNNPLDVLQRNPTVRHMVSVTFSREQFLARLQEDGLRHPEETYREFSANMRLDSEGGFQAIEDHDVDVHAVQFAPVGAQEQPELADTQFSQGLTRIFGADDAIGLSIQREDLLHRAVSDFHRLAADAQLPSVAKAQQAMGIVQRIADPELGALSSQISKALIDGEDTPDLSFSVAKDLDAMRIKARDMLFSGQPEQAIAMAQEHVERLDALFAENGGVPRYFNSYAERVVYNHLFATPGEHTVLIPDNLFYAHMELADVLAQLRGPQEALPHLNAMVSYAPAYPLSHMRLAMQLARNEDWDSARAACLNALRVALDRDDAAFAYYRFAYAEWMRDEFDVAAAAYMMSEHIAPGQIAALQAELRELSARADSQCIRIPRDVEEAQAVLIEHDLPVWPHTQVAHIVRDAARASVDNGMFVLARTLSVASARMSADDNDGIDMAQVQFLRSLGA